MATIRDDLHGETSYYTKEPKTDASVELTEIKKSSASRKKQSRHRHEDSRKDKRTDRLRSSPKRRVHHSRRHRRSRSNSRISRRRRYHRQRSSSVEYGGYIPRRRHGSAAQEASGSMTGFSLHGQSVQNVTRLQQGFSPLPCPTRQVYVGNLVPGMVSDLALRTLFDSALSATFPDCTKPGTEPVVSVSMHSDGRYAFVELRSPEMATAALQLSNQVQLFGQTISVGRPSGYVDPSKAAAAAQAAAAALAAFNSGQVSAEQTFGGLNLPPSARTLGQVLASTMPTPSPVSAFLSIEGLLDLDMLRSNETYRNIVKTLRNECIKFGQVVQLKIPRPADPKMAKRLFNAGIYGKAFVQFNDATTAMHAKEGLLNLASEGRKLTINFVSQDVFIAII